MKILRIIARLNVGGPARHVVWLTDALQDDEFESVLVAGTVPPTEEDMGYFAEEHSVKPIFIEEMSRELSPKDAVSLWKVYRTILREKPEVIHTHTAKAGTVGRAAGFLYKWFTPGTLVGRPRRVRLVHTYHGHIFHSYYGKAKTRFFLFIERTLARLATDRIIVITEQQRKEIHEDFGVGRSRQFEVVPLGIDLSAFEDALAKRHILREEIGASDDELVVGIVGRLTEIKDHELFLEAVKEFDTRSSDKQSSDTLQFVGTSEKGDDKQSSDTLQFVGGSEEEGDKLTFIERKIRFVIIGDGHMRPALEARAKELGIEEKIVFLGNREDPDVFYAGLDIVALTSRNEGTPLSLIEAMANRRPVVSTAVGGVVDLLGGRRREAGDRSQESEVRSQETGDRRREAGDGRQETGDRRQETGVRSQESEVRRQETGDGRQEAEVRGQRAEDKSQESGVSNQGSSLPRRGEMPLAPSAAVGGTWGESDTPFREPRSGGTAHRPPFDVCERGIAVTSRDPAAFARALEFLASDPGLREELAQAGLEFVTAKYDKARLVADIKALYRDLTQTGKRN